MSRLFRPWRLALAVLCAGGCITPWNTRLPTFAPSDPAVERRLYQVHDPFPDQELGPETMTRPRAYEEERPQPRQIQEGRTFRDLAVPAGPSLPPLAPSSYRYPAALK
ncbi:MAG: hypothetical protein KY476_07005 [Planctomycetes bacterium]|nr:hypothetical protein [Planctomycetota bacterium]